jgi:hypothetical protein
MLCGEEYKMAYILRFVQHYRPSDHNTFLQLESKFKDLERRCPNFPQGRRYQPVAGGEPTHTLIWECEFPSLHDVQNALSQVAADDTHTELFAQQSPLITDMRTEIYKVLDF